MYLQLGGRRLERVSQHDFVGQESIVPLLCDIFGKALRALIWHFGVGPGDGGAGFNVVVSRAHGPPNVGQKIVGRLSATVLIQKSGQWSLATDLPLDANGKFDAFDYFVLH